MSRRRGFLNNMKEQVGRSCKCDVFIHKLHGSCMTQEKLPPRLNLRGISLAARVVSHEIRNFTKKTTGKDLADIRDSKMRNEAIKTISDIKVAMGSEDTRSNLLTLAYSHSTNFTKSLSPDGVDFIDIDFGIRNINPYNIVDRYHKQCRRDEQKDFNTSTVVTTKYKLPKKKCGCDGNVFAEKKGCYCFLSCWEHKGIKEDELNR